MSQFIGIDLGTLVTKLLLVDEQGAILNSVSKEYTVAYPHPLCLNSVVARPLLF